MLISKKEKSLNEFSLAEATGQNIFPPIP